MYDVQFHGIFRLIYKIGHVKQQNGTSAKQVSAIKKNSFQRSIHSEIKFEDGSIKQNIVITCIVKARVPLCYLKWRILKILGKIPWTS